MNEPCLVNLSGGTDSVYSAYAMLKEGRPTTLHHCRLKYRWRDVKMPQFDRWVAEKQAVDHVLKWFGSNGLAKFEYVETEFNYGIAPITYDIYVIGVISGLYLIKRPDIKAVVVSSIAEDYRQPNYPKRAQRRNDMLEATAGRQFQWLYPSKDMTKRQIIDAMPYDLFKLAVHCHRERNGAACGRCAKCRQTGLLA